MSYLLTARAPLWFWVFGWLLTLMTVAGNGLVIYLITASQRLHTRTNWFILSLAFADLFFGSIYFPSLFACDFCLSCDENIRIVTAYQLAFISVANLCVMTLDRYVAIVKPLRYFTIMNSKRILALMSVAWILPVFLYLIPRLVWLLLIKEQSSRSQLIAFCLVHPLVLEILPWFVLILFLSRILLITRKFSRQRASLITQLNFNQRLKFRSNSRRSREVSSAQVVVIAVTMFIICYTCDIAFSACTLFGKCRGLTEPFQLVFRLLWITNSGVNPLAYAFLKRDIKRELKRLFSCKWLGMGAFLVYRQCGSTT